MNLDRLEQLLETMSPDDIRAQYGEELAKDPRSEAMLATFEGMDDRLKTLKDGPAAPEFRMPKRYWSPLVIKWALPLAAVVVLGLLFGSGFLERNFVPEMDASVAGDRELRKTVIPPPALQDSAAASNPSADADRASDLEMEEAPSEPNASASSSEFFEIGQTVEEGLVSDPEPKQKTARSQPRAQNVVKPETSGTSAPPVVAPAKQEAGEIEGLPEAESLRIASEKDLKSDSEKGGTLDRFAEIGSDDRTATAPRPAKKPSVTMDQRLEMESGSLQRNRRDRAESRQPARSSEMADALSESRVSNGQIEIWLTEFQNAVSEGGSSESLFESNADLNWPAIRAEENLSPQTLFRTWQGSTAQIQWQEIKVSESGHPGEWLALLPMRHGSDITIRMMTIRLLPSGRCVALSIRDVSP